MDEIGIAEIAIGAAALVASVVIYFAQRGSKRIDLAILANRPLLDSSTPLTVQLQIGSRLVTEPSLVVFRLASTGNAPVRATDFEKPISIEFQGNTIASSQVTGARPSDFAPQLTPGPTTLVVESCLWNPGDTVEIQCLVEGAPTEPAATSRAAGVNGIRTIKLPRTSEGRIWRLTPVDVSLMALSTCMFLGIAIALAVDDELRLAAPLALFSIGWVIWCVDALGLAGCGWPCHRRQATEVS